MRNIIGLTSDGKAYVCRGSDGRIYYWHKTQTSRAIDYQPKDVFRTILNDYHNKTDAHIHWA